MKKLFLSLFATVMLSSACYSQKKITIQSTVTEQEYKAMDNTDKKIANYIDAGIAALKAININEPSKKRMQAVASISLNDGNKLENMIAISESEGNLESIQSCMICGAVSGMLCYKKIRTRLTNGTIIVTMELVGECVQISW